MDADMQEEDRIDLIDEINQMAEEAAQSIANIISNQPVQPVQQVEQVQPPESLVQVEQPQEVQPSSPALQVDPVPVPSAYVSEADAKINNILEAFSMTRQNITDAGFDVSVLEFLPEFELVSLLSDIASNIPQASEQNDDEQQEFSQIEQINTEDRKQEQPENVEQVVQEEVLPTVENVPDSQSQPVVRSSSRERLQPAPGQAPSSISQPTPVQDSLTNMMQSLLGMSSNVPNPNPRAANLMMNTRELQQMQESIQNALQGMNMGMNAPNPNPGNMPNPFFSSISSPRIANPFLPSINPMAPPASRQPAPTQNMPVGGPTGSSEVILPEGIDREFFYSLPEEYRQELLRNEELMRQNLGQAPTPSIPQSEPEQMDTASFLATITDESLRREILIGMDEGTLNTLPPRVQAEARRFQRDVLRRQYRREREDPERLLSRLAQQNQEARGIIRELRGGMANRAVEEDKKQDNFMDIIKRREERCAKNSNEPQLNLISSDCLHLVFNDDKNLKNIMKILIIESQRKTPIKFERFLLNLIRNYSKATQSNSALTYGNPPKVLIDKKVHQILMLMLKNYKSFSYMMQYQYIRHHQVQIDQIFPPIFMLNSNGTAIEEIQFSKIALFVFSIFNHESKQLSKTNPEAVKNFFSKDSKADSKGNFLNVWQ